MGVVIMSQNKDTCELSDIFQGKMQLGLSVFLNIQGNVK